MTEYHVGQWDVAVAPVGYHGGGILTAIRTRYLPVKQCLPSTVPVCASQQILALQLYSSIAVRAVLQYYGGP